MLRPNVPPVEDLLVYVNIILDFDFCFQADLLFFSIYWRLAMKINKSQDQTRSHVGLYLSNPAFCHG